MAKDTDAEWARVGKVPTSAGCQGLPDGVRMGREWEKAPASLMRTVGSNEEEEAGDEDGVVQDGRDLRFPQAPWRHLKARLDQAWGGRMRSTALEDAFPGALPRGSRTHCGTRHFFRARCIVSAAGV